MTNKSSHESIEAKLAKHDKTQGKEKKEPIIEAEAPPEPPKRDYAGNEEKFLTELLPVIDNLERAISAAQESRADALAIIEGINLTLKMLYTALEKAGVQQVNPVNEPFNPSFHEAVSMQADGSKPGMVISVLQKGYLLNERLVRPAMVIVSK